MTKFEQTYGELVHGAKKFGEMVELNLDKFKAEDSATLRNLGENWTFVSLNGDTARLKNQAGIIYDFNVRTHEFTRVISDEEKAEIEKKWPKSE